MLWTDRWVGKEYQIGARGPDRFDCIGLLQSVLLERHGIIVDDATARLESHIDAYDSSKTGWFEIDKRDTDLGDVLVFRGQGAEKLHVAYAVNKIDMLHTGGSGNMGSRVETWRRKFWEATLLQVWRHA